MFLLHLVSNNNLTFLLLLLSIASYKYIDSCIFKPTVYRTYKYLHKASILGSEDLLLEGRTCILPITSSINDVAIVLNSLDSL